MQDHIFQNAFYETPPLPTWSYEVFFLFNQADQNSKDRAELLASAVQSVTIPGQKVETLDVYFAGFKKGYQAKPTMNGQIQMKFNDNDELDVRRCLEELFQFTFNPDIGPDDTNEVGSSKNFSFDMIVRLINPYNDTVAGMCKYYGCFIQSISDLNLDYKGDDVIDVTATIDYKYFKVVPWNTEE